MTDVNVSLHCQSHCQPVGGGVEDLWHGLHHVLENVAECLVPLDAVVRVEGVEEDVAWTRKTYCQQITHGHGFEDCVGGGGHVVLVQHDDDD